MQDKDDVRITCLDGLQKVLGRLFEMALGVVTLRHEHLSALCIYSGNKLPQVYFTIPIVFLSHV